MAPGSEAIVFYTGVARLTFEEFYASEFERVFAACYAFCRERDVANEATQEAFARAFARWRRLSHQEWAGAWVTTTALNWLRRNLPARREAHGIDHQTSSNDLENKMDVMRALNSLPVRQRQATVLFYVADYPISAIAELMHLSEGTVKVHLSRARKALRRTLEEQHE